jgi:uncharacterized membrane protein YeaQ/YmgE (transglycosylase-associated protein family)
VSKSARSCSGLKNGRGLSAGVADHKAAAASKVPAARLREEHLSRKVMKLFTIQSLAITALLFASPALAQTNDQAVNEGAGVIAWILVGLIGGYLASRMVNKTGEGLVRDIILGIIGGIVGGVIFRLLGGHGVTGFNLWSILVAFIGGVAVLLIYHAMFRQRRV